MKKITKVETKMSPKAIGPYSQAVKVGNYVYCSGQIPIDPITMKITKGGIEIQTKQVLENIRNILSAAGSNLSLVIKVDLFLNDLNNFEIVNEIYSQYFTSEPKPSRVTVEVSRLPKDSLLEMSCVAITK